MKLDQETFEAEQRRITGQPARPRERLASALREISWLKILVPAVFFAVFAATFLRDFLDDQPWPDTVFFAIGGAVFLLVFAFSLVSEIRKLKK